MFSILCVYLYIFVIQTCSVSIIYRVLLVLVFFFFNQKPAYEMRISDWSSDVCSSDLLITATFALSGTSSLGAPPKAAKAWTCASVQSASVSVQVAQAKDRLDAPITATKMCAARLSPVRRSMTTPNLSPA